MLSVELAGRTESGPRDLSMCTQRRRSHVKKKSVLTFSPSGVCVSEGRSSSQHEFILQGFFLLLRCCCCYFQTHFSFRFILEYSSKSVTMLSFCNIWLRSDAHSVFGICGGAGLTNHRIRRPQRTTIKAHEREQADG